MATQAHTLLASENHPVSASRATIVRTAADIVRMEVHYCVSSLVGTLVAGESVSRCGDRAMRELFGQAVELAAPVANYEDAAIEAGFSCIGNEWRSATKDASYGSAEDACRDWDIEPYDREVFEHWIVSDWLAKKLAAKGEKVDSDFAGMTVWARTTTGQSISIDAVIAEIVADLAREYGA